jgi:hypothetical protein
VKRDKLKRCTLCIDEFACQAGDGVYSTRASDGSILLTDVSAKKSRVLVNGTDVKDVSIYNRLY